MEQPPATRKTGRPLSFDRQAVLRRAMLAFWRHGYETTSISDLTAAMGVSAPSIYTAFGDKRGLFLEAVRLYAGDPEALQARLDAAPNAAAAAADMLTGAALHFTGDDTPPGCLLASATATGSAGAADVRAAVSAIRDDIRVRLVLRIERDMAAGMMAEGTQAETLAATVVGVVQGLSVLARDGMGRGELLAVAESALCGWPGNPPG